MLSQSQKRNVNAIIFLKINFQKPYFIYYCANNNRYFNLTNNL